MYAIVALDWQGLAESTESSLAALITSIAALIASIATWRKVNRHVHDEDEDCDKE